MRGGGLRIRIRGGWSRGVGHRLDPFLTGREMPDARGGLYGWAGWRFD